MSIVPAMIAAAMACGALIGIEMQQRSALALLIIFGIAALARRRVMIGSAAFAVFYVAGLTLFAFLIARQSDADIDVYAVLEKASRDGQIVLSFLAVSNLLLWADLQTTLNLFMRAKWSRPVGVVIAAAAGQMRLISLVTGRVWLGQWGRGQVRSKPFTAALQAPIFMFVPIAVNFLIDSERRAEIATAQGLDKSDIAPGPIVLRPRRDVALLSVIATYIVGATFLLSSLR